MPNRAIFVLPLLLLSAACTNVAATPDHPSDTLETLDSTGQVTQAIDFPDLPEPSPLSSSALALGRFHSCALLPSGGVACWGSNAFGQRGTGTLGGNATRPVRVTALGTTVTAIGAGKFHTCVVHEPDGIVQCFGHNGDGKVAPRSGPNGPPPASCSTGGACPDPVTVAGITGATSVAAGDYHTCIIRGPEGVCWGRHSGMLLGGPGEGWPTVVSGLPSPSAISAGERFSCGHDASGQRLRCWGQRPETESSWVVSPRIYDGGNATAFAVGEEHLCTIRDGGTVWCWGETYHGECGVQLPLGREKVVDAVQVPGITGAVKVAAGRDHTCAILANGTVKCWGANARGQLGNGTTTFHLPPVTVSGLAGITAIAASGDTTCAIGAFGATWCWGMNDAGQLGDGTLTSSSVPRRVRWPHIVAPAP
jgi:alpha-tubulin suppressor-like RCC1 family protein